MALALVLPLLAAGGTATGEVPTRHEAESATISQGVVESNHADFTGTGFVNYDNVIGSFVEFTMTSAVAETTTLSLRFANGTTTNRPMDIMVNGTPAASGLAFSGNGSWSPNLDSLTVGTVTGTDWSVAMVESTMDRFSPWRAGWTGSSTAAATSARPSTIWTACSPAGCW